MELTKKQLLINQLLTDLNMLRKQEEEITLIINKVVKLKAIEDEETEKAEETIEEADSLEETEEEAKKEEEEEAKGFDYHPRPEEEKVE